jgi:sigma-B regulation protein RsbU (phosphoserine phosphatase)
MEQRRPEHELQLARRVMQGLLPSKNPTLDGFDIATFHEWSSDVGGDYYDFIPLGDQRWGLLIADVEGKGMAAALLVSAIRASVISLAGLELALRAIFRRANQFFHDSTEGGRYVTLFYAVLDVPQRRLIYVNAGHLPGILVRADGRLELLEEGGLPLGLFEDPRYYEGFVRLNTGDAMILFTDGITDAANAAEEPYGLARLSRVLQDSRTGTAAAIRDAVVNDVRRFAGDLMVDDETIVILKAI